MESLSLEQVKIPWMQVSREGYSNSGVYAMRHLEMYMGDADKWNLGLSVY